MKMKRLVSILLVLVLTLSMVFCMSGCGNKASNGVTVQIGPNPETLDPALNSAVDGGNMLITLFETLLIIDENNHCLLYTSPAGDALGSLNHGFFSGSRFICNPADLTFSAVLRFHPFPVFSFVNNHAISGLCQRGGL